METPTEESGVTRIREDVVINRPIEDVFARLTDISHYSDWMARGGLFKESKQCSEGPVGPGTPYIDKSRMGTFRGDVAEFERPRHVLFREQLRWFGRPMAEASMRYDLEPTPEGTVVHHEAESRMFGVFRMMEPVAGRIGRWNRHRTIESLKKSLEAESLENEGRPN